MNSTSRATPETRAPQKGAPEKGSEKWATAWVAGRLALLPVLGALSALRAHGGDRPRGCTFSSNRTACVYAPKRFEKLRAKSGLDNLRVSAWPNKHKTMPTDACRPWPRDYRGYVPLQHACTQAS